MHLGSLLIIGGEILNVAKPLVLRPDDVDPLLQRIGAVASVPPEVVDNQIQLFTFGIPHDQQHVLPLLKKDAGGIFKFAVLAGTQAFRQILDRFIRFRRKGAGLAVKFLLRHPRGEPAHKGVLDSGDAVARDIGLQRQHVFIGEHIGIQCFQTLLRNRRTPCFLGGKHAAAQHAAEGQ